MILDYLSGKGQTEYGIPARTLGMFLSLSGKTEKRKRRSLSPFSSQATSLVITAPSPICSLACISIVHVCIASSAGHKRLRSLLCAACLSGEPHFMRRKQPNKLKGLLQGPRSLQRGWRNRIVWMPCPLHVNFWMLRSLSPPPLHLLLGYLTHRQPPSPKKPVTPSHVPRVPEEGSSLSLSQET